MHQQCHLIVNPLNNSATTTSLSDLVLSRRAAPSLFWSYVYKYNSRRPYLFRSNSRCLRISGEGPAGCRWNR